MTSTSTSTNTGSNQNTESLGICYNCCSHIVDCDECGDAHCDCDYCDRCGSACGCNCYNPPDNTNKDYYSDSDQDDDD